VLNSKTWFGQLSRLSHPLPVMCIVEDRNNRLAPHFR
jgi:hypothetical protein